MNVAFFNKRIGLILCIIVIVGGLLRLVNLGGVPAGFHEDEAHIGYNAYSLIKTLHDKNNVLLPLSIDQFGDFRPSGLHFLAIPSVLIFGLTEFATRLPVAIFGTLSIVAFYFLAREVFKKQIIALIAAGMMSLNPWHIIASRSTSESIVAIFLVILGTYLLLRTIHVMENRKGRSEYIKILIGAFVAFILSFQFYHAARYFVPFLVVFIGFWVIIENSIAKKAKLTLIAFIACLLVGVGFLFSVGSGGSRVSEISIFHNPATQIQSWEQVSEDKHTPSVLVRFFHNKITAYSYTAIVNYSAHFTPDFLFFKGGLPPRYQVPWNGNFYIIDALFILLGLVLLATQLFNAKKFPYFLSIPIAWALLGPIPAAFTFEDIPHFQRAIMMLPGMLLLCAYGFYSLVTRFQGKRVVLGLRVVLIGMMSYLVLLFAHDYFVHTNTHNTRHRNEGEKELLAKVDQYKKEGKNIVMTSEGANLLIFYLFYNKFDPKEFQRIGSPRDKHMLRFDGLTYFKQDCPSYDIQSNINNIGSPMLVVDRGECLIAKGSKGIKILNSIKRPDGTIAFKILEIKPVPLKKKLN